jgi:two-component system chemotaxis response regulator CheY
MTNQAAIKTLIVEDSMPTRRMLRARLETLGCTVVGEAESPSQGLKLFRELDPDIVTLDLIMPQLDDLNADGLFKIIRREKPATSVIVISSMPRQRLVDRRTLGNEERQHSDDPSEGLSALQYLSQGAIAYLEKPFVNFDQLRDKLEALYPQMGLSTRQPGARVFKLA